MLSALVEARMYQWVNPHTGSSQLSGKAPAWYRSEMGGPRVLVFEKNKLVDDTAVMVSEEQRIQLKNNAFNPEPTEQEKILQRQEAVAKLEKQIEEIVESPELEDYLQVPVSSSGVVAVDSVKPVSSNENLTKDLEKTGNESTDERVERLKALISAWDKNRTERAKSLVETEDNATDVVKTPEKN